MEVLSAIHSTSSSSSGGAVVGIWWSIVIACTRVIIVLISTLVVSVVNRMILISIGRIVNSRLTLNSMFLLVMMMEVIA